MPCESIGYITKTSLQRSKRARIRTLHHTKIKQTPLPIRSNKLICSLSNLRFFQYCTKFNNPCTKRHGCTKRVHFRKKTEQKNCTNFHNPCTRCSRDCTKRHTKYSAVISTERSKYYYCLC